jgi:mRNA interferase YafQ
MRPYSLIATSKFKKDYRRCAKRGWNLDEIDVVIDMLLRGETLPSKYQNHALKGDRKGQMDCHIRSDWVLLYEIMEEQLILILLATGSHTDLGL